MEKIPVISTRTLVEEAIAKGQMRANENFKLTVFSSLKTEETIFDFEGLTNLLVIGDSNYEIDAAIKFGEQLKSGYTKTIKLAEKPCPQELVKQVKMILQQWDSILSQPRNLKIRMERNN